ncbi:MAG: ABC transporter ATP-binding protein [Nitrospiraceae bacterium]|nr:MAG: ABC transporter ATP-binding protein [Nitrospiraceae bacterium]
MASDTTILDFDRVQFSYERHRPLIRDMSFFVGNGEFIGLLGANGSGKSTVLKIAGGILTAFEGRVNLWGRALGGYRNRDRAKLLSYLPQILDMNIPFTVEEIVSMGLYPYDIRPSLTEDEALGMVGLREKAGEPIRNLSGGERRRVYIAMTLLQGAGLVLMDEPLANLDIKYQVELLRLLKALRNERGITVVMALHDIHMAMQFERIILIKEGRIIGTGSPQVVLSREALREAFDVDAEVRIDEAGGTYLRC